MNPSYHWGPRLAIGEAAAGMTPAAVFHGMKLDQRPPARYSSAIWTAVAPSDTAVTT